MLWWLTTGINKQNVKQEARITALKKSSPIELIAVWHFKQCPPCLKILPNWTFHILDLVAISSKRFLNFPLTEWWAFCLQYVFFFLTAMLQPVFCAFRFAQGRRQFHTEDMAAFWLVKYWNDENLHYELQTPFFICILPPSAEV